MSARFAEFLDATDFHDVAEGDDDAESCRFVINTSLITTVDHIRVRGHDLCRLTLSSDLHGRATKASAYQGPYIDVAGTLTEVLAKLNGSE